MKKVETKFDRYVRRQRERGMVKITKWVPAGDVDRVNNYIAKVVKANLKKQA